MNEFLKLKVKKLQSNWVSMVIEDLLIFMLAIDNVTLGLYFMSEKKIKFSPELTYQLGKIMNLNVWGTILFTTGILLVVSSVIIKDGSKQKVIIQMITCGIGFLIWVLYAMMSREFGVNNIAPFDNMVIAVVHLTICLLQAVELWRRKIGQS